MANTSLGSIEWSGTMQTKIKLLAPKLRAAIGLYMQYQAPVVQSYMRSNAKWTDRTGNARNGLFAKHIHAEGKDTIVAYHTLPYGIWLEVRFAGKYAVIYPTINNEGKRIFSGLKNLLGKMVI